MPNIEGGYMVPIKLSTTIVHNFLTCRYERICEINVGDCLVVSITFTIFVWTISIEMSGWGNNTSWSVDSDLLYILYKDPPSFI